MSYQSTLLLVYRAWFSFSRTNNNLEHVSREHPSTQHTVFDALMSPPDYVPTAPFQRFWQ